MVSSWVYYWSKLSGTGIFPELLFHPVGVSGIQPVQALTSKKMKRYTVTEIKMYAKVLRARDAVILCPQLPPDAAVDCQQSYCDDVAESLGRVR